MTTTQRARPDVKHRSNKSTYQRNPEPNEIAIKAVWPDGTWNMPWPHTSNAEMDLVTQAYLRDAWLMERHTEMEASLGREIHPDLMSEDPIPEGWKPSMAALKKAMRYGSAHYTACVVVRLEGLNRLKP